jgi:hypothetical protein
MPIEDPIAETPPPRPSTLRVRVTANLEEQGHDRKR